MEEQNRQDYIDLRVIIKKMLRKWWVYMIVMLVVGIGTYMLVCQVPRYYDSKVMLAPETEKSVSGGTLSSLASQFGLNMGNIQSEDAIYPMLYPDLFESNDFICSLFDIQIETMDGKVRTDYYDYLRNHQQHAPWDSLIYAWRTKFKEKPQFDRSSSTRQAGKIDPFMLSEKDDALVESVKGKIKCDVDKKTDVITISVRDQDPLVCATMVDSIKNRLQRFITEYRTSKSRADYEYYAQLAMHAREEYDIAVDRYSEYCDTHRDVILQAYISERDNLENDMQAKYNTYTAMNTQLQAAKAKIQEHTPAFTLLQSAYVPVKPAGPKRMIISLVMMFMAFIVTTLFVVRKELFG